MGVPVCEMARFTASRDMGLQEIEVFRPFWPMSDGFRASSWLEAQDRLKANTNDR
jgi:hypothetical protein